MTHPVEGASSHYDFIRTGLGQQTALRRASIHTGTSNTDFSMRGLTLAGFTMTPAVARRQHYLSRAFQAVRLLQAAAPICGDVHGPLLHPARPGRG